jgi:GT2 family glycosyltransferase
MAPTVSVIVPTFRRFGHVLNTLSDLLRQEGPAFDVVVADQNLEWPAEFAERLAAVQGDPRVKWLRLQPPGVVAARNEAVRQSAGEILIFVDDDVLIRDTGFLEKHVAHYVNPEVAGVIGRERTPDSDGSGHVAPGPPDDWTDRHVLEQIFEFHRDSDHVTKVCTFSTCNGSVRRTAFLSVGGFDENFTGNSYGDDHDLAVRMYEKGLRFIYDPATVLVHLNAPAGGLRLTDPENAFDHTARAMCQWLFYHRHARPGYRWMVLYRHVLRKTVFLKANLIKPWRQFAAWAGLIRGYVEARRRVAHGFVSRFVK